MQDQDEFDGNTNLTEDDLFGDEDLDDDFDDEEDPLMMGFHEDGLETDF